MMLEEEEFNELGSTASESTNPLKSASKDNKDNGKEDKEDNMEVSGDSQDMKEDTETPKETKRKQFKVYENTTGRVVSTVPAPAAHKMDSYVLFNKTREETGSNDDGLTFQPDEEMTINIQALRTHLIAEGRLHHKDVVSLVGRATQLLAIEPNLLRLDTHPVVTVCGDTHGQFYDLLKLFEVGGDPANTCYLFLGDYVDRGSFSMEIVLLLFAYKITYPDTFFLLRGNHECRHLSQYFTFKGECMHKYSEDIYDLIMDSFDALPLAAILNKQFLCVHGGLSPSIKKVEDIENINRFREPPESGPMCDLLWSDPMEHYSSKSDVTFEFNDTRGCSYSYGYKAVCDFLDKNGLLSVIRAHEVQDQGYRMHLKNEATGFPSIITIFSAPNYLDAYNNKGAVLRYENNVMNIRQFNHSPHPYWLPNFMDVFSWSMPFVAEKVAEILLAFLNLVDDKEDEVQDDQAATDKEKRRQVIRNKVLTMSRMMRMYSVLCKERETLMQIRAFTPENKIPQGLLSGGVNAIKEALGNFEKSKTIDKINEKRPELTKSFSMDANEKLQKLKEEEERRRQNSPSQTRAKAF